MTEEKKTEWHIFIDIDGVLADFDSHARAHDKFTMKDSVETPKWNELDYQWWVTMPAYEGAKAFYDSASQYGTVRMLTAPVPMEDSFAGKAKWATQFRPEKNRFALLDLNIVRAKDKYMMAGANRILIDDREKNVKEWEAAGGIGIHHKGDFEETLVALKKIAGDAPRPDVSFKAAAKPPKM